MFTGPLLLDDRFDEAAKTPSGGTSVETTPETASVETSTTEASAASASTPAPASQCFVAWRDQSSGKQRNDGNR
jgi:hypothetical protein